MINTTIVTAFFDIGRSSWDVGFRRTNSHYYSYFKNLCKLKNDIVVFTSEDLIPYIKENTNKTNICLLYTSPSPRDRTRSRMPSSA